MRQTIMLMAACAALLASCTNEEMNEGLGIDTPIQVTASVEGALTTRTDNSTESLSTFGLSIKDGTGYTGNYAGENILAEKDNGTWTLGKTVLYQGSGQSYYAYAPYKEGHTGESLTFTVDADQATNDLQGSDLLHASGKVESAKLDITLAHKLSKLTVTVTKKGETNPIEVGDVTLRGTVPTATLDLTSDDVVAASGTATEIKMWHNTTGGTYECILVPQAAKAFGVSFTYGGDTYLWESSSYTFEGGNAYTLALTFDGKVSVGEVTVSEWGKPEDDLGGGTATETDYTYDEASNTYTVYTAEGLQEWRTALESDHAINCTLAADIDMRNTEWEIITYSGTFDGNGHTITGLTNCFTYMNAGTIKNLTLVEPKISVSTRRAGTVASENWATIENCHVVGGSIEGTDLPSGGIAGLNGNKATIRACSSSAAVTIQGDGDGAGGIVGINSSRIIACYATGSVTGNNAYIGAIVGRLGGELTACYWSGNEEKGVGGGLDTTTKVEGDVTWTAAMTAMNTALSGTGYQWELNPDDKTGKRPLIITNE
ncbi:MAG TPA: fimbrillin family protein [Candidatus Parabacteroides intestinipullorum]|uniref:Fimbrillin family protein n=1 Tax=Candidatus Parabacteroides intestinipullorum TaxID=2838723 RepID=A0A9D2BEX6_9BACT|nr:fimbrillin family protein [Candidatus Parabacteroides intestinipullorum]